MWEQEQWLGWMFVHWFIHSLDHGSPPVFVMVPYQPHDFRCGEISQLIGQISAMMMRRPTSDPCVPGAYRSSFCFGQILTLFRHSLDFQRVLRWQNGPCPSWDGCWIVNLEHQGKMNSSNAVRIWLTFCFDIHWISREYSLVKTVHVSCPTMYGRFSI